MNVSACNNIQRGVRERTRLPRFMVKVITCLKRLVKRLLLARCFNYQTFRPPVVAKTISLAGQLKVRDAIAAVTSVSSAIFVNGGEGRLVCTLAHRTPCHDA